MENARQENRSIGEEDKSLQTAQPSNNLSCLIQHFKNNTRSNFKPGGMVSLLITAGLDHTTKLRRHLETSGLWIFTHISPLLSHNHWLEPNSRNLSFAKKPPSWNSTPTTPPLWLTTPSLARTILHSDRISERVVRLCTDCSLKGDSGQLAVCQSIYTGGQAQYISAGPKGTREDKDFKYVLFLTVYNAYF